MNTTATEAARIIDYVRGLPVGPFVGSTPAIMDAPSIDPAPDPEYPGFADVNKNRRTLVWLGGNRGLMHAFDGRLGIEVWAFIPFNLLPKLAALLDGHAVGNFDFFVDSSAKVADVRVSAPCSGPDPTCWRTYLFFGEGPGGTFYQAFDVTMSDMATVVSPTSDNVSDVLGYFSDPNRITFKWAFPSYQNFDYTLLPYGDIKASAPDVEKTVGETWSDPAVGRLDNEDGRFTMLTGSGFFPASKQLAANRGGLVAGSTFYLLDVETGVVFDSRDVGNDNKAENVDNCALQNPKNCEEIKNALQADPVATGPPDSRYITKAYLGDLDGRVWRFDVGMVSGTPRIKSAPTKLYDIGANQPIFASMATVNVGANQYIFFATGSDLLPTDNLGVLKQGFKMIGVLDPGGTKTFELTLTRASNRTNEEKPTAYPAVAGDIVFFTTTMFHPATPCAMPDANLYAVTFIGGPAYDNTGDNKLSGADSQKVKTISGARATAPFIVDQHVVFGSGSKVQLFGDSKDYNNGVGQVGVRTLSWREVR
jgi:Tfp pilus tip-associated adhesin PilY1